MSSDIAYESAVESIMDIFAEDIDFENSGIDMFSDNVTGYKWIDKPQKCVINGLNAAYVKYETCCDYNYEIHFERIKGFDRQLELFVVKHTEVEPRMP